VVGLPGSATVEAVTLVLHVGGPRHRQVAEVPAAQLSSARLVYDGPQWFGVYERVEPVQRRQTAQGSAEVWVVRE
jgi:hypothetical protein